MFVITRKSIENHDIFHLMKYLNAPYVVLNIYYLVGNYVNHLTKNFNEIFYGIANTPFAVYVLFVQQKQKKKKRKRKKRKKCSMEKVFNKC